VQEGICVAQSVPCILEKSETKARWPGRQPEGSTAVHKRARWWGLCGHGTTEGEGEHSLHGEGSVCGTGGRVGAGKETGVEAGRKQICQRASVNVSLVRQSK